MGKGLAILFFLIMIPFSVIQILIYIFKSKLGAILKWGISVGIVATIIILGYADFILIAWIPFMLMVLLSLGLNHYFSSNKKFPLYLLLFGWVTFIGVSGILYLSEPYFKPVVLTNKDIYGSYIIDKSKFPGQQADWQHENFRFKITETDTLIFEYKLYENKWKTENIKVSYSSGYYDLDKEEYCNRKLRVHSDLTNHHIIKDNPTLYRKKFGDFYYVFESEKFGNVFFKKGIWEGK
jgi:hypothetical protein